MTISIDSNNNSISRAFCFRFFHSFIYLFDKFRNFCALHIGMLHPNRTFLRIRWTIMQIALETATLSVYKKPIFRKLFLYSISWSPHRSFIGKKFMEFKILADTRNTLHHKSSPFLRQWMWRSLVYLKLKYTIIFHSHMSMCFVMPK